MTAPNKRPVGRPQGAPTTIINLRIPLDLLERLDRYVDFEEQRRRGSVNRAIVMREALTAWLQTKGF
jgi:hypothetical protein